MGRIYNTYYLLNHVGLSAVNLVNILNQNPMIEAEAVSQSPIDSAEIAVLQKLGII